MKLKIFISTLVLTSMQTSWGQESTDTLAVAVNRPNTIENQFDDVIEKSNSWQQFKVVPKMKLYTLKKNIQDSLKAQQNLLLEKTNTITGNEQQIKELNQQIDTLQNNLNELKNEKDSINFFGALISKGLYSVIVWGIIFVLTSLLAFYIFRFSKSNIVTKRSIKDLEELQSEYEDYRSKAIEREQKVRRQLQDEINKNRGI